MGTLFLRGQRSNFPGAAAQIVWEQYMYGDRDRTFRGRSADRTETVYLTGTEIERSKPQFIICFKVDENRNCKGGSRKYYSFIAIILDHC